MLKRFNRIIDITGIIILVLLWGIAILIRTIVDGVKKILKIRR